ncbi:MAG: ECF transporter S component [Dehalobacterium sp.]
MKFEVKDTVKISIMAALSFLIMLIEFPLPFMPPFLQLDFSEIPALLIAFSMGPLGGVMVELIKNLLHLLKTQTSGIGELANFLVGVFLVVPAGLVYQFNKSKKGAYLALACGVIFMTVFASVFNYLVLLPLYAKVLGFPTEAVVAMTGQVNGMVVDVKTLISFGIIPFNVIKGIIISILVIMIYKRVSPILHK